ncbi:MAG: histidine kinase [Alphaproteobacteria bacterium]|nr:histidine kinase [Alphaproteobacteria bacterium]
MSASAVEPFRTAHAAGPDWQTAAALLLRRLGAGAGANLGFLYVSDLFADDVEPLLGFLRQRTGVEHWLGTVGVGVCATGIEYFDRPAMAAMIGRMPEGRFALFDSVHQDLNSFITERRDWLQPDAGNFGIVHVDPRRGELFRLLPLFAEASGSFLVGALTSSRGKHPQLAGGVTEGGVSGLLMSPDVAVATALTQGCSPIGPPHEVTDARQNVAVMLDGRPALDVFREDVGELLAGDLKRCAGCIYAAVPVAGSDWGDYMVRNLAGIDERKRLVAIGDMLQSGQRLMFCRRDRQAAANDLGRMLAGLKRRLSGPPRGALYHSCLARGANLFDAESVELGMIREALGEVPLVGFFGNGEISNSRLYTYTGVLTVFL